VGEIGEEAENIGDAGENARDSNEGAADMTENPEENTESTADATENTDEAQEKAGEGLVMPVKKEVKRKARPQKIADANLILEEDDEEVIIRH